MAEDHILSSFLIVTVCNWSFIMRATAIYLLCLYLDKSVEIISGNLLQSL
jgi:hypothetical protein